MKRIGLRKTLLISFAFLFTLCIAAFGISLVPETARAVPSSAEKTVPVTEAFTFTGDDMTAKTAASDTPANGTSWNTTLGMTKFARGFNQENHKFYMGFEAVDASDYAFVTFRTHLWGEGGTYTAPHQNVGASKTHNYLPTEIYNADNVSINYKVMVDMTYHDSGFPIEENVVSIPTSLLKGADGKVSGLIIKTPTTEGGWFMVSDVTFTNEARIVIDYETSHGSQGKTTNIVVEQESWGHASWQTEALRNRVTLPSRTEAFDVTVKFPSPLSATEVDSFTLKMLGWEDSDTATFTIKNLDGTEVSTTEVYFNWNTNGELKHTIPAAGLKNSDGKIEGFIISSPRGATNFVFSDITAVKGEIITEAAITAENVTFKMGGDYGMSVYYDFDAVWGYTGHQAGWIVNDTSTKGDVNIRLSIAEETSSGGNGSSRLGLVRIPDLNSPYGNERGLFNAFTQGAKDQTFSTGIWPGKTEFLMAYTSATPNGTITLVGTAHAPQTASGFIGKLTTYDAAKDCEYFGIGWLARGYSLKSKIQIYDASNNDLGIRTSLWERTKLSCSLMGKVGETVSFTAKEGYIPVVTTASGSSVELTEGANGVYSFVMPAEAVNVTAAASTVKVNFNVNGVLKNSADVEWNEAAFTAAVPTELGTANKAIGIEYNGKLYKNAAAAFAAIGKPEGEVTVNVVAIRLETQEGASIRDSGVAGLRFTSVLGQSAYVKSYGMILTVWSNVNDAVGKDGVGVNKFTKAELEAKNYKYLEVKNSDTDFRSYEKEGNTVFNLVLSKIQDGHRELEYIARTYVTVEYDGGASETIYSDVNYASNARSAHNVATFAIQNAEASGLTSEQIAFIEENYLSKKA